MICPTTTNSESVYNNFESQKIRPNTSGIPQTTQNQRSGKKFTFTINAKDQSKASRPNKHTNLMSNQIPKQSGSEITQYQSRSNSRRKQQSGKKIKGQGIQGASSQMNQTSKPQQLKAISQINQNIDNLRQKVNFTQEDDPSQDQYSSAGVPQRQD